MRVSQISIVMDRDDLQDWMDELLPESGLRIVSITPEGIRGQVKLLWWHVDFLAVPSIPAPDTVAIDISAHKLVPIPSALVQRQLKEAVRDGPPGISVMEESLRVHLPSLLAGLGVHLHVRHLGCEQGRLTMSVEGLSVSMPFRPRHR
ncbi:hypothetical protein [Alicyclobacillus macrosporangiidus]|uniref:Uncharacterized protein n=1 Tax=Alicyclobacillus macrosporangiidus TaxID=392015 RepID=A0A1I7L0M2_9BACL|nr:hypothetical protein [Alicyclobacillus macrosporangiidus]SFV03312.1 hypothetical protein SAMN05421543_12250 [Alicyclobacillus macrosporangiidus]